MLANSLGPQNTLFRDDRVQALFERDGYVILDLLSADEVSGLLDFAQRLDEKGVPRRGFRVSMDLQDQDLVRAASAEIQRVAGQALGSHVHDHQSFVASFVVKDAHEASLVPPHQDWAFVDETRFTSATVWTALVDMHAENGGLGVIPGSHRVLDYLRASPSPQCPSLISPHLLALYPYLQVKTLRAGQAIAWDHRLVHGSPPNRSLKPRIAAGIGIARREAPLLHHYLAPGEPPRSVETYAVDPGFFHRYGNAALSRLFDQGDRPEAPLIGSADHQPPVFCTDALLERLYEHPEVRLDPALAASAPRDFAALRRPS
jgi:hypothetical protein